MDVADSAELKRVLVEAVASRKELHVEIEKVTDLDVTAVQLLWATRREAEKAGTLCLYSRVPERITVALKESGFEDFTGSTDGGDPPAMPGADSVLR